MYLVNFLRSRKSKLQIKVQEISDEIDDIGHIIDHILEKSVQLIAHRQRTAS